MPVLRTCTCGECASAQGPTPVEAQTAAAIACRAHKRTKHEDVQPEAQQRV